MKKTLALILSLLLALSLTSALADDLGVTIIGGDDPVPTEPLDLDDMQIGTIYDIPGYAKVLLVSFDYIDAFPQYAKDLAGNNDHGDNWENRADIVYWDEGSWYLPNKSWKDSGTSADFAWLLVDLTNLKKVPVSFMQEASVKVVYDDEYEYAGWMRQFNYDYDCPTFRKNHEGVSYLDHTALDPENEETVDMVYTGHYVFGCTLPNMVVEDKDSPLKMVIDLGGNELTYNIRK